MPDVLPLRCPHCYKIWPGPDVIDDLDQLIDVALEASKHFRDHGDEELAIRFERLSIRMKK